MDEYTINLKVIQDKLNDLGKSLSTFKIDWEDWTPNERHMGIYPIQISIDALDLKRNELDSIIKSIEMFKNFRAKFGKELE